VRGEVSDDDDNPERVRNNWKRSMPSSACYVHTVRMQEDEDEGVYAYMYLYMHICIYICMYVCNYICISVYDVCM